MRVQGYDTHVFLTGKGKQAGRRPWIGRMEPGVGIEPTTYALQVRCSTTELTRQGEAQS